MLCTPFDSSSLVSGASDADSLLVQAEKEEKEEQEAARKAERDAKIAAISSKKGGKKK